MTQALIARPEPGRAATRKMSGHAPGTVLRERLVRSLLQACDTPLVLIAAPAGYGKSTLVSQWAAHDSRPFAVVAMRTADNEPRELLESIARGLPPVARIDEDVFLALSTPGSAAADMLGALARSFAGCEPFVLALDDVGLLATSGALATLTAVAAHVPAGSQLVLASRSEPALRVGRLRAQRRLLEVRAPDLVMNRREAGALLAANGVELARDDVLALLRRTDGWPVGLVLAALALQRAPDRARAIKRFGGGNRFVAEYLRDEVLAELPGERLRFLMRTSMLDVLSAPVCDATLGRSGSGAVLRDLVRANVLLEPLDQSDEEYRCHPLFAEMLRAELRRVEPERERELRRRAADFYAERGDLGRAVDHAVAANDAAAAGRFLWASAASQVLCGCTAQTRIWLDRFGPEERAANPGLALTAAATHVVRGERDLVEHWATAAERALGSHTLADQRRALDSGVAIMRAVVAREGLAGMAEDAVIAYALAAEQSPWRSLACLLSGVAAHLRGERERARPYLREGARRGAISAPAVQVLCLAQLTLMSIEEEDWAEAEALSSRARGQAARLGLGDCPIAALIFAVSARVRAQRGRAEPAQDDRRATLRLLGRLTDFVPWYMAEVRVVLAGAAHRLGDGATTRELLAQAVRDAREMPDALVLRGWIERSIGAAGMLAESMAVPESLTTAELRVLQLLPTHLSFREMAVGLQVSANTVKTHAHAVYRKLDACSRSEAVTRAIEAGLIGDGAGGLPVPHERFAVGPAA